MVAVPEVLALPIHARSPARCKLSRTMAGSAQRALQACPSDPSRAAVVFWTAAQRPLSPVGDITLDAP